MSRRSSSTDLLLATAVVAGLLFAGFDPAPVLASARAVDGTDRAIVVPPAGATIEAYQNPGYRLERLRDGTVEVEVVVDPMHSESTFVLPPQSPDADGVELLARSVVSGSPTHYAAVSRLLAWVSTNIRYDLDRSASQAASDVLARRSAYCTGVARLTVAMLQRVGIEAREVSGFVVGERAGSGGYHRWIEAYYPDSGWHFSDPLSTHHWVPASYLRLAAEELDLTRSHRPLVLERDDRVAPVDVFPLAGEDVLVRRNSDRRRAAAVTIRSDSRAGTAWLVGNGELHTLPLAGGRGSFLGLPSGEYDLMVRAQDGRRWRRRVEFSGPGHVALELKGPGKGATSPLRPQPDSEPHFTDAASGGR